MGFFKSIKTMWQEADTAGKVNMVLDLMIDIGSGIIGGGIGDKFGKSCATPVGKVCCKVTGIGLGFAVADAAKKPVHDYVDTIAQVVNSRKKEESGNA